MPPWLLDRRTLLAQMAAVLASPIAAFGQKRRIVGAASGVPSPPIEAGNLRLGYSESELPAMRTRLQTAAASGGDKELFVSWLATIESVFDNAITGTNYYSEDAGLWAMAAADLYMLDPLDASWKAAGITFPATVATQGDCLTIADNLIRLSTYHRGGNVPGVTCISRLQSGGAVKALEGSDTHMWNGIPTMLGAPVWYVWERIRAGLTAEVSGVYETAMKTWVDGNTGYLTSHPYINVSKTPDGGGGGSTSGGNSVTAYVSHLAIPGARVLLGTGAVTAEQETAIETMFTNAYLNRIATEHSALWTPDGIASPSFHEATTFGLGYAADNANNAARHVAWMWPSADFQTADYTRDWFTSLPESILKGLLPGANASNPLTMGQAYMMGVAQLYQRIALSGDWIWFCAAAALRQGLTTQARQLKWIAQNYCATTSVGGVLVPTMMNTTDFRAMWSWNLIMTGGVAGLTALPITAFTTRKGQHGTRIANDLFDNPTRGTFVMFSPILRNNGASRPGDNEYADSSQIWTRGSWVRLRWVGGNKGAFATDSDNWFFATVSRVGYGKITDPAWHEHARGYTEGFPAIDVIDPAVAAFDNGTDFKFVGDLYADDPDHSTGFYSGYEALWRPDVSTRTQRMFLSMNDKDLVVEFVRATPVAGYYPSYVWTSPVHLDYHNGTETIPDHYLLPGTPANGVWLSADADTFVGENYRASSYVTTHKSFSFTWPAADAKWFTTIKSLQGTQDWRLEYRGYDAAFVGGAHRNNLEIQLGDSDYGRNSMVAWNGIASAVANGTTTVTLTDNPPVLPHTVTHINLALTIGAVPILRTGNYDAAANTFVVTSGGAVAAGTYNYSLLDTGRTVEFYPDQSGDAEEVRSVAGNGSARILGLDDSRVDWCIVTKLGASTDGAFTAPPVYSKMVESDVWGIHIATDNVAVVVSIAYVSREDTSDWRDGYDFLLPTTTTTQVHCCDLIPGVYGITRATEGGTNTRVTINPAGTGFTVGASGRIVVSVSSSSVTLV